MPFDVGVFPGNAPNRRPALLFFNEHGDAHGFFTCPLQSLFPPRVYRTHSTAVSLCRTLRLLIGGNLYVPDTNNSMFCVFTCFSSVSPSPHATIVRGGGNKRVDNGKMRALLEASGRPLVFPDYRV